MSLSAARAKASGGEGESEVKTCLILVIGWVSGGGGWLRTPPDNAPGMPTCFIQ